MNNILDIKDNKYTWLPLVVLALVLGVPRTGAAQIDITLSTGGVIPLGATADVLRSGYAATAAVGVRQTQPGISWRVEGTYYEIQEKYSTVLTHTLGTSINVVARSPAAGYLVAGIGSFQRRGRGNPRSDAGGTVGAGIGFPLAFASARLEARVHYVGGGQRAKYFPITFGIVF